MVSKRNNVITKPTATPAPAIPATHFDRLCNFFILTKYPIPKSPSSATASEVPEGPTDNSPAFQGVLLKSKILFRILNDLVR